MCADIALHDKNDGNPHCHILLTMRPLNEDTTWGAKSKKEYILDKNGEKVKLKNGNYKTRKINTTDWNEQDKAEEWRKAWADITNKYLGENSIQDKVDHRSYQRQGIEQIPTIHLGVSATQMETKGIATDRGNINREIKHQNMILREISRKIKALLSWIRGIGKEEKTQLIDQSEKYLKYKDIYKAYTKTKKSKQEDFYNEHTAELILFESAKKYLKEHLGESKTLAISKWKSELATLKKEKKSLCNQILEIREEVAQAEKVKTCMEQLQEQEKQLTKKKSQNLEL